MYPSFASGSSDRRARTASIIICWSRPLHHTNICKLPRMDRDQSRRPAHLLPRTLALMAFYHCVSERDDDDLDATRAEPTCLNQHARWPLALAGSTDVSGTAQGHALYTILYARAAFACHMELAIGWRRQLPSLSELASCCVHCMYGQACIVLVHIMHASI